MFDNLTADIAREQDPAKRGQLQELFSTHLDEAEGKFNRREQMLMRMKRSEIESAANPLLAKAEIIKDIYLDSIALSKDTLAGTDDDVDESEIERSAKDQFYIAKEDAYAEAVTQAIDLPDQQDQEVA
jgi:ferritin-like metal-binding protein YciE